MAPYCTKADLPIPASLAEAYATDATGESQETKDARIAAAIDQAQSEVDGYVGVQYTIPLDPVPKVVRDLTARIAVYKLAFRQGKQDAYQVDYDGAVRFLRDVAAGKATLGPEVGGDPDPPREGGGSIQVNDRVFTRETLQDY